MYKGICYSLSGVHMDCSSPGFSVHGILQARVLGWVAMPLCKGFQEPRRQGSSSCPGGERKGHEELRRGCSESAYSEKGRSREREQREQGGKNVFGELLVVHVAEVGAWEGRGWRDGQRRSQSSKPLAGELRPNSMQR